ncbi:LuxR family transcriptional regulator [Erwinia sp. ErVv1]|uniref:LuxR family transcriptional regulator n=1 Tax=Erwinia sp. ErVv1 TaxID=1603299 RepID=UPI0008333C2B|nr:LuxR family transcriptional regulator [Erwinia sp. ErVv1]
MDAIYLDQSYFHQQGLTALIGESLLCCCSDIREIKNRLNDRKSQSISSPLIIFDLPANFRTTLTYIDYLTRIKINLNATLIFFSDFERNIFSYSEHGIKADFFIDKKSSTDMIISKLAEMLLLHKNGLSFPSSVMSNDLTKREFSFLCSLFTQGSIDGVAKITGKNKKTLYSYQANVVKKLNLKNSLHLYKRLIHHY